MSFTDNEIQKPNILFLFADDQRFDTIHALGNKNIKTPNMDRLVENGTSFTNAHIMGGTSAAVCMPSRAMLLSGRTMFNIKSDGEYIPDSDVTLPEVMRNNGYNTFGTGKWHNGTKSYARSFESGSEIFFGGMTDHWNVPACRFSPTGCYPDIKTIMIQKHLDREKEPVRACFDHIHKNRHSSELISDAALDFLSGYNDNKPFFMFVSYLAPHDPRTMPEKYLRMYEPESIKLPPNFMPEHPFDNGELDIRDERLAGRPRKPDEIKKHIAAYYAMITHLDEQIGKIINKLKETGMYDNTIIVFAGDNGLAVGQHGLMGKQNMYDHSIRIPVIICGPGISENIQNNGLCYLHDIYPTLCDLTGIRIPETVEGNSLVPLINNMEEYVYDSVFCGYRNIQRCIRDERYKLITYYKDGNVNKTQLFDTVNDPWELQDISQCSEYKEKMNSLLNKLKEWQIELCDPIMLKSV